MPVGTISDPHLNPREENFGIIFNPEDNSFCLYDKGGKDSPLRYLSQGTEVSINAFKLPADQQIVWNGIQIINGAELDLKKISAGPVYTVINTCIKNLFFHPDGRGKSQAEIQGHLPEGTRQNFTSVY